MDEVRIKFTRLQLALMQNALRYFPYGVDKCVELNNEIDKQVWEQDEKYRNNVQIEQTSNINRVTVNDKIYYEGLDSKQAERTFWDAALTARGEIYWYVGNSIVGAYHS